MTSTYGHGSTHVSVDPKCLAMCEYSINNSYLVLNWINASVLLFVNFDNMYILWILRLLLLLADVSLVIDFWHKYFKNYEPTCLYNVDL